MTFEKPFEPNPSTDKICNFAIRTSIYFAIRTSIYQPAVNHLVVWIFSKWSSMISHFLRLIPSFWVSAGHSDLLLMNIIQQRWWNVTSIGYRGLWLPTFWQFMFLSLSCLPSYLPLMKPAAMWERSTQKETEGNVCSTASEELRHSKQSGKKLNPASNHVIELGSRFFLNWVFKWDHRPSKHLRCDFVIEPKTLGPASPFPNCT